MEKIMEIKEKPKIKISMWIWYFFIFSIVGLLTETIYGYATTGILESRQGLIWGPFCPIYGIGATIFIIALARYKKHPIKLFIAGALLGAVVEYILSYALEAVYGNRFWDYTYTNFHINGRICVTYSFFWGILAVVLIKWIQPWIDKMIEKIKPSIKVGIEIGICMFIIIDGIATVWAVQTYTNRAYRAYAQQKGLQAEIVVWMKPIEEMGEKWFPNDLMAKTFPNIRIYDENKNQMWAREVLSEAN